MLPLGELADPAPPLVVLPDELLLLLRVPLVPELPVGTVLLVPELLFGAVLIVPELSVVPMLLFELSYVPPRFSREAHPAATRPAKAINAINFFIIIPFDSE